MEKHKPKQKVRKRTSESIVTLKKELKALTFEPIYGESLKEIVTKLTTKIQEIIESYGYEVEFPERAKKEVEGDVYYFIYPLKIKTKHSTKKVYLEVEYLIYDENAWMGIITDVK
ncbi:hypothetical protein EWF20_13020 [Sulfolobus sp. S-194]|uniref:hypothetical protein n=1 Tax=Sulfolobus sp. S-194 TaxID=2512240 RepID=UPI001436DF89|nr:hypothetical protein [Sulfolobus sp. S-194]QIW24958.1 hypothetical protein EWF20_13020 [Sulfolobus sp. S-194]